MSDLLLDAHALRWFVWDDSLLSAPAKAAIENADNRKLVSVATCWEIAIKAGLGKLMLGSSAQVFLSHEIARNNFELLPVTLAHATYVETLPAHHKDPFDRMLVSQAILEGISIVSRDEVLSNYSISRLW